MDSEAVTVLLNVLVVYNLLFAALVISFENRSPASTWAWLMVIALIPYVGSFLYLLLGFEPRKYRTFRKKQKADETFINRVRALEMPGLAYQERQEEMLKSKNILGKYGYEHLNDLVYLNWASGNGAVTTNNEITEYFEGDGKFNTLLDDIRKAKSFVHLQYYILRNDKLGKRILTALAEKAKEGVEVKLLVDGGGTAFVPKSFYRDMIKAGGKLAVFLPLRFVRLNFRNHRKLAVIDGVIGYIGGLNIGEEYLGKSPRFGNWRDTHIRIRGDAVKELELQFIMDWNHASKKDKIEPDERYFPVVRHFGNLPMQIVSSGPDTRRPNIYHSYIKMMMESDKSIFIQTPYFVPDEAMFECLRIAALSGIDVRIVIPRHPDHFFVYWASTSYLAELLEAGVKCYEYDNGFMHSKLIIIDEKAASVGTANMDVRSFNLNFEINSFIFDEDIIKNLNKHFLEDLNDCVVFDFNTVKSRTIIEKIKEAVSRLMSPLL